MRRPAHALTGVVIVVSLLSTLASSRAVGQPEARTSGRPVATVGRETVTTDDLAAYWFDRHRDDWVRTVEGLLDDRIASHEVRRLGLSLPPGLLDLRLAKEVEARRRQLRETFGEEVDLAGEVRRGYGLDVETWKRRVLTPRLRQALLLQRVVRLDTRRRERVKARVIVFDDEMKANRTLSKLRSGADFSLTALQESVDPTAQAGGDLPSIARGDLVLPGVEDALFQARAGQLVGPLPVTIEGRPTWHVYKVIQRVEPWGGRRADILAKLEKDLVDLPVERGEFERWRARTRRDFRVRVFGPDGEALTLPGE